MIYKMLRMSSIIMQHAHYHDIIWNHRSITII